MRTTLFISLCTIPFLTSANEFAPQLSELATSKIDTLVNMQVVIDAVNAQNTKHAQLSQAEIDSLDKQWRSEVSGSSSPLIDEVLSNSLSATLAQVQEESGGLYTEIFVMDNKGLNVGQSAVTSDYWQGDEAKWKETYMKGAKAIHISEVEEDESTQTFQSQVSYSITDPASGNVIGAITVGVNVEEL
ncbi:hypothetical protein [Vibrio sp. SCSIO 43136]|uniref:hypothetical protein n=1 Tax=Vibrio sp. SCSIO 43136 TaxID=2819101 RepID=UPI002075B480|nr:hypothetical protein [Vibrio sp. SCSIO 43136]USD64621.1 hypothetical protein J4N39_10980 [Vibrio sp. SCSIO 43136]